MPRLSTDVHILIVEDDANLRYALLRLLERAGHTTCWAATGDGALRLLRTEPVELMLLDMLLPDRSGWDVRRDQLSDPTMAQVPVIVISGMSMDEVKAPMSTVQLVMTKPLDPDHLLAAIEHIGELAKIR